MSAQQAVLDNALLASAQIIEKTIDEKLRELDEMTDDDYMKLKQKRFESLKQKHSLKQEWMQKGHGKVMDVRDAKEFFQHVKDNKYVVVLFYRPSNSYCDIVLSHLQKIAPKHLETLFIKVDGEQCPIVVEHLKIWMMPTIVCIKNGRTDDSIVGLDDLGGANFTTTTLRKKLLGFGVIEREDDE
ncbi:hypothetical protein FDP41_006546 [Naegleria fowleri]|uniref:Thioredoxin domain-containing protein n=1 Tax=Naegleria fowleri TaxID=5763 RepID=A0A6A5BKD5_NAEFO|nr:uncharacterized protein FDP41_006546 [Naegleria fowleri]KAF0974514.1 hypothetical protein FDP41_006546 [Naegleria fowleri]CAG4712024.1 unnamed protein product [Naegleria fowleri]